MNIILGFFKSFKFMRVLNYQIKFSLGLLYNNLVKYIDHYDIGKSWALTYVTISKILQLNSI